MMELFAYAFMRRAFLVGILLGGIIPCIGVIVVLRRLSMIGDALSHASLAGVAAGLLGGINPLAGAAGACVAGALGIELVRRRLPRYAELSIAVILSAGVGLAGLLSGRLDSATAFNSFLFGSIVAISDAELAAVVLVSLAVAAAFLLLYHQLLAVAFDERGARLTGVPVQRVNLLFTLLTALAVAVAARTVGALMVSSLMVIPVVAAMQLAGSYRSLVILSAVHGVAFSAAGLTAAYYLALRPGASIVLCGIVWLLVLLAAKRLLRAVHRGPRGMRAGELPWPHGVKKTRTRLAVLQALAESDRPLTAVEIASRTTDQNGKPLWLSTVYRALDTFEQCGAAHRTPLDSGVAIYELAGSHRHYAVCLGCNRIIPLENCPLDNFLPRLSEQDFEFVGHRLQLYGYCAACREQRSV